MIFPNGFNDELSRSYYKNFLACQRPETFEIFSKFIKEEMPHLIIEIGSCFGGLSYCLYDIAKIINATFITFDIVKNDSLSLLETTEPNIDIRIENIFDNNYNLLPEYVKYIQSFSEPILILCDGGNKKEEYKAFSRILKKNDILMAHDFSYNQETFETSSVWGWKEIDENDIINSMKDHIFYYYKMDVFSQIAWVCTKKLY